MSLPRNLASKFAKITKGDRQTNKESTVYGTIKEQNGTKYVLLDGANILTPVMTTVDFEDGERVTVLLKNHTATVTGNITSPASRDKTVKIVNERVSECESSIQKTPEYIELKVSEITKYIDDQDNKVIGECQSLIQSSSDNILGAVEEVEGAVGNNTTLINSTNVHRGKTPPANPEKEKTLWVDYSVTPPLLKKYNSSGTWESIGSDKFKTSYISIQSNSVDIGSGGSVNINSGAGISIKSGGSFTVDADNLDIDGQGVIKAKKAELTEASINGNLTANGYPVWHAGNIVISSSAPSNPTTGMVWINPSNDILQTSYYASALDANNALASGFIKLSFVGAAAGSATGMCTYNIKVPMFSYNESRYAPHYVRAIMQLPGESGTVAFPIQEYNSYGLTWYEQSITVNNQWIGTLGTVSVTVYVATDSAFTDSDTHDDLYYPAGHQATLTAICKSSSTTGWLTASVKYFAG